MFLNAKVCMFRHAYLRTFILIIMLSNPCLVICISRHDYDCILYMMVLGCLKDKLDILRIRVSLKTILYVRMNISIYI